VRPRRLLETLLVAAGAAVAGAAVGRALARRGRELTDSGGSSRLPALEQLNARFHADYDCARHQVTQRQPILLAYADSLVLLAGGARRQLTFTPPLFHAIKAVTHAPIALYAALHPQLPGPLAAAARRRLETLAARAHKAQATLVAEPPCDAAQAARLAAMVARVLDFAEERLASGRHDPPALAAFAAALGPALLQASHDATRLQLAALDGAARQLLATLDADEQRRLQVVVAGAHQARVRSLAMQYFRRLLDEPPHSERRVTYAEGIAAEDEAVALVSTRRLDRDIARAFFGDPDRLQRDILGDAARELLEPPDAGAPLQ
jgi:hypothetical protein